MAEYKKMKPTYINNGFSDKEAKIVMPIIYIIVGLEMVVGFAAFIYSMWFK